MARAERERGLPTTASGACRDGGATNQRMRERLEDVPFAQLALCLGVAFHKLDMSGRTIIKPD